MARRSAVGADAEAAARAVVPHGRQVTQFVGAGQRGVAVAVERQAGAPASTRAVAVEQVAHVAVEARHEHGRRRRQRGHAPPVGRRQTTHVDVAVVRRVAETAASSCVAVHTSQRSSRRTQQLQTRSSAIAAGPRDASCQLKSCQLPRNSTETIVRQILNQVSAEVMWFESVVSAEHKVTECMSRLCT